MFYLLADNRIIDSRKVKVFVKTSYTKFNYLHRNNKNKYCIGIIEKQSENVYDLIDWEKDLVRVDDAIKHCKYFHRDLKEEYIENKWFNAIYKPDEKGNYIKAWEVKEDD